MPARKIGNLHGSLSGVYSSAKLDTPQYYESSLERDFLHLLDFDPFVSSFSTQPVTIDFAHEGNKRKYTPDILVKYVGFTKASKRKPLLVEIKYREDLKKNWKELKPRFLAAMRHADQQGWKFKIMTEVEIRTEYLDNVKLLLRYKNIQTDVGMIRDVLDCLYNLTTATPAEIISACTNDKYRQAELIPVVWFLVSNFFVGCDLTQKLTMTSPIWIKE